MEREKPAGLARSGEGSASGRARGVRGRRGAVAAVSALAGIAILGVLVAGAWGQKLKTRSASSAAIESPDIGSASAKCPRGTKVVSGGFQGEFDLDDPDSPGTNPVGSWRSGQRRWKAAAFSFTAFPGKVTAYAYCRDERVKGKSKSVEIDGISNSTDIEKASLAVKCPKGMNVVSGGFDNPNGFAQGSSAALVYPYQSKKHGKRRWLASGSNIGNEDADFSAYAYCRHGEKLKTRHNRGTITGGDNFELSAKCGRKQRVVSGGFDAGGPFQSLDEGVRVLESRKRGKRRWVFSGANTGSGSKTVTAFAYCGKA